MDHKQKKLATKAVELALASVESAQDEIDHYRGRIHIYEHNPRFSGEELPYIIFNKRLKESIERLQESNQRLQEAREYYLQLRSHGQELIEISGDTMEENQSQEDVKKNDKNRKKLTDEDDKMNSEAEEDDDEDISNNRKRRRGGLKIKALVNLPKKVPKIMLEESSNVDINNEQKLFEECERKYLAKINRWNECVTEKDMIGLEAILRDLVQIVDQFSAPFVQSYDIVGLIKRTDGVVPSSSVLVPLFNWL